MLSIQDAVRVAFADAQKYSDMPLVIKEVWADDSRVVVVLHAAGVLASHSDGQSPILVDRSDGHLEFPGTAVDPEFCWSAMTRHPWPTYRPVDRGIPSVRIRKCRQCGGKLVPIVWGFPDDDLVERVQRGEAAFGGCIIPLPEEEVPTKECRDCGWRLLVEPNNPLIA